MKRLAALTLTLLFLPSFASAAIAFGALLKDKPSQSTIKGEQVARIGKVARSSRQVYDIEIVDMRAIDGGVEVFARAWKDGVQVGFGQDGTIDIERFRFFNPPVLVPDINGTVLREYTDSKTGTTKRNSYREDPKEAILQSLEQTISVMKNKRIGSTTIVSGKRGNTTSTFYSSTDDRSLEVDGTGTWAGARDATTGTIGNDSPANAIHSSRGGSGEYYVRRFSMFFVTSAIGTDAISAATLSVFTGNQTKDDTDSGSIHVVSASAISQPPVSDDFDQLGSTSGGSTAVASFSNTNGAENTITLDATGMGFINKSGTTKLGLRHSLDLSNTTPTGWNKINIYQADNAGTTLDPKLVVEHAVAVSSVKVPDIIFFD